MITELAARTYSRLGMVTFSRWAPNLSRTVNPFSTAARVSGFAPPSSAKKKWRGTPMVIPLMSCFSPAALVWDRRGAGGGISGVVSRDNPQHMRRVLHRPGHRTAVVLGPTKGYHSGPAYPSVSGLNPDDAAQGGGSSDRAPGAGTQGTHALTGGHRGAGAAAGATGDMGQDSRDFAPEGREW